ncbi:MAG: hypothetical protein M1828_004818 [Chrysothrix sp. TS-e1954]|nr:MAG: hypothetical protein M1828_004818 [Chrysothrix sp. TS-e1954]
MFASLNRFIARLDSEPQNQQGGTHGVFGFQVLKNTNTDLPIEPWFDFIIGINGRDIDNPDPNLFSTEVHNCAGNNVSLGVWSAKGQRLRSLYASVPPSPSSLGLSLQWTPISTTEDVWHILEVTPNSPADLAGLLPYSDYVIGSPEGLVRGESGLGELVEHFLNRPLRLHVYNHEYNITRLLTITPSRTWGGTGALGCILGFGALHRIPPPLDEPPPAPGETFFDTVHVGGGGGGGNEAAQAPPPQANIPAPVDTAPVSHFLVPANLPMPPQRSIGSPGPALPADTVGAAQTVGGQGRRGHKAQQQRGGGAGMGDMDEYFAEGEAKSLEQDHAPSSQKGALAPPPPPPKAGQPPARSSSLKRETADTEDGEMAEGKGEEPVETEEGDVE